MSEEELIEVLRQFDEKRVEELPEKTRNIFYAIMKIADERDELENIRKEAIELLKKCGIVDEKGNFNAYLDTIELKELLNILNKGEKK